MRVAFCDSCGGPLEAPWTEIAVVCRHCGVHNLPNSGPVPSSTPSDARTRLNLGGRTVVLEGLIGQGDSAMVYRARWVRRLGELLVVKVARTREDLDLLRAEFAALQRLCSPGDTAVNHFITRLPVPVCEGAVTTRGERRWVTVYRWQSGMQRDLTTVRQHHPDGIDGHALVWVAKRTLETLAYAHRRGVAHGAVLPPHLVIHPREHAAMLVGWTLAGRLGRALPGQVTAWKGAYTHSMRTPALDLNQLCWTILWAARANSARQTGSLPRPLAEVFVRGATAKADDAWALRAEVDAAAAKAYGPPSYHPLPLPRRQ